MNPDSSKIKSNQALFVLSIIIQTQCVVKCYNALIQDCAVELVVFKQEQLESTLKREDEHDEDMELINIKICPVKTPQPLCAGS